MSAHDPSEPQVLSIHNGYEVYPMPMFMTFETADVNALARWYQEALGFGIMFQAPGPDGAAVVIHLRRMKYQDVLILRAQPGSALPHSRGSTVCFQAGVEIEAVTQRAAAVPAFGEVHIEPATDTAWNTRQVRILDPDGRELVFTHPRFDPELTRRWREQFATHQKPKT